MGIPPSVVFGEQDFAVSPSRPIYSPPPFQQALRNEVETCTESRELLEIVVRSSTNTNAVLLEKL